MHSVMTQILERGDVESVPFIWFWPAGASSCAMMTHDVEGPVGKEFCDELMDVDEAFDVVSAFQVVPEGPRSSKDLAPEIRRRGFEVNLHDLNHDGFLFRDSQTFLERVARINGYARELNCRGFRSAAMYRRVEWFNALDVAFDMSVPNVAHLEPQRGGCCTVLPYFIGHVLELPLTTVQDYSLFHILDDYSIELWKTQIDQIDEQHGLITLLAHPDYLVKPKARAAYIELLAYLRQVRAERGVWCAPPAEVDHWWRSRAAMTLVYEQGAWHVHGPCSERARLAYASLDGDHLTYTLAPTS
jgi:hypothetical protein